MRMELTDINSGRGRASGSAAHPPPSFGHGGHMPFPDAERAVVTEEKVRDYLLNPSHPLGGRKAAWFGNEDG
jgi:hypothetical protein